MNIKFHNNCVSINRITNISIINIEYLQYINFQENNLQGLIKKLALIKVAGNL